MGIMEVTRKQHLEDEGKKCCVDCKTTKTPLWRGGPAGPKSLCNACGIRFRKRRISTIGTNRGCDRMKERADNDVSTAASAMSATTSSSGTMAESGGDGEEEDFGEGCGLLRMRLMMALGKEVVVVQNLPSAVKKQRCQRRRKLGEEEEQAAVSLMALSCGSVIA